MTRLLVFNLLVAIVAATDLPLPIKPGYSITKIVPHCTEDYCSKIPPNVNITDVKYYKSLRKLLSGGITQLIWESVSKNNFKVPKISDDCSLSLQTVWSGVKGGNEVSFRMISSSARSPTAHLDGTVTSFGDYDQCLDLSMKFPNGLEHVSGKYCVVPVSILGPPVDDWELFQRLWKLSRKDKPRIVSLKEINIFKEHSHFYGLCLPSTCSVHDIKAIATIGKFIFLCTLP